MENKPKFKPDPKLKLMEQVRQVLRYHHYAYRTEQIYCDWIVRFIKFHGSQTHPAQMGKEQIDAFLSHLATQGQVSASTQSQASNAIIFLYRHVLDQAIEDRLEPVKAKRHARPPTVMTQSEVQRVMEQMVGTHLLMAKMLYGCGLRLMECVRPRVQDLDMDRNILYVRDANGGKDRTTIFPQSIHTELRIHLENGVNIRVVQELMGHADGETTEIYTHVMEKDISAVSSPLDRLLKTDT
jgi:site-specific recombinase XerD